MYTYTNMHYICTTIYWHSVVSSPAWPMSSTLMPHKFPAPFGTGLGPLEKCCRALWINPKWNRSVGSIGSVDESSQIKMNSKRYFATAKQWWMHRSVRVPCKNARWTQQQADMSALIPHNEEEKTVRCNTKLIRLIPIIQSYFIKIKNH